MNRLVARLATALAIVTMIGLVGVAPASSAVELACEFSVPELPDECLSQAAYEYIVGLKADRDAVQAESVANALRAGNAQAEANQLRLDMWTLGDQLQAARQATSIAQGDLAIALASLTTFQHKVIRLRAKVKRLRDIIHDMP